MGLPDRPRVTVGALSSSVMLAVTCCVPLSAPLAWDGQEPGDYRVNIEVQVFGDAAGAVVHGTVWALQSGRVA